MSSLGFYGKKFLQITAFSLVLKRVLNGGGGPHFLSGSVISYILNEPLKALPVTEVPDFGIREKIMKVGIHSIL